jgi:hypothetical protein
VYFIFEIFFESDKSYIFDLIEATAKMVEISVEVIQNENKIVIIAEKEDTKLENFLKALETTLPASIYLKTSNHYIADEKPLLSQIVLNRLPQDLSLCPTCQKEMFDVSSRRYYYPFTSCNSCGAKHAFLEHYPFTRQNSSMKFLVPCEACQEEMVKNPLRKDFSLISCCDCGIAIRMVDKKSERYANDKGTYRTLFEVSARAIAKGKTVVMKTLHGYRKFYKPTSDTPLHKAILLICDVNSLNKHLMMVPQEFNALLSIERPLIRIATKSDEVKTLFGSSIWTKYPDDGMSMLLAKELLNAGLEYIVYEECDEESEADFLVDFDLPITPQKDFKLFINQDTKLLIEGERSIFPQLVHDGKAGRVSIALELACVDTDEGKIIDKVDHFAKIPAREVLVAEGEKVALENAATFEVAKASVLSVLAEHQKLDDIAIGVHFDERLHFLYYNQKEVIDVVPPRPFDTDNLFEEIAKLREGSDRLVVNFQKKFPAVYERLDNLTGEVDLFKVTAILMELENESFDGISEMALSFLGKGGMQVDTKVRDNRFNDYAFLASIMSYKISGVEPNILCYSIYESFGDYIADIVTQLMDKTKAKTLTLSGRTFANQSLWGRIQRNLAIKRPILNKNYPIGKENSVYGAQFL